jgi:hypothetical protein
MVSLPNEAKDLRIAVDKAAALHGRSSIANSGSGRPLATKLHLLRQARS